MFCAMMSAMSTAGDEKRTYGGPNKAAGETGPNLGGSTNLEFTQKRKQEFCEELAATGRRLDACRKVGVHRSTITKHLEFDPAFKSNVEDAMEEFRELLQKEALRRAVEGNLKPIYFQGVRAKDKDADGNEIPAAIREFDTTLLVLLLKRHCPEFKDKSIVENRNVNVDMGLADMAEMTPKQRAMIRELIETEDDAG